MYLLDITFFNITDVAYVILAAEWDTFVIFKTVDKHGTSNTPNLAPHSVCLRIRWFHIFLFIDSVTYVALTEEAYNRKDKSEIDEKVSRALVTFKVDEKSMKTFTRTFQVKTNSIKPANQKPSGD